MIYLLDTNIFIRYFTQDHKKQFEDCKNFLEAVRRENWDIRVSGIVIAEITWTLGKLYGFSKPEILRAQRAMLDFCTQPVCDKYQYDIVVSLFSKNNVKYIDCVIASIPEVQKKQWVVVSFDRDFDKLGVIRKEPKEIITSL